MTVSSKTCSSRTDMTQEEDDNRDGFHNLHIEKDEYEEPVPVVLQYFRIIKAKLDKLCESSRPEGYYHDPDQHDGLVMYYLDVTAYARNLTENENFNYFIILIIILAGINVGIQTYPQMEHNKVLNFIDGIILLVFSFEVIVKMAAEGLAPLLYFFGKEWKWNNFDFAIVFLSLPFWDGLFGGGSLALLRLVRLMRLAKLIKKIPALQMIIRGLTGGLKSIAYILLLLVLVFYLFAVTGYYLFSANDPFHFKTLPISMITMFRCATLDAWSDVMYLNIFGCDSYPYLYIADEADFTDENYLFWCEKPKAQYAISALYFVFFIVMSALVMLSLFIGAVTLSMNDSLVELKTLAEERKRKERYDKNVTKLFLANARVEKRKKKKDNSLRSTWDSVRSKLKMQNSDLEKFKTEMQIAPQLVAMHRMQGGEVQTRSALLNHKKGNRGRKSPSSSPQSTPPGTPAIQYADFPKDRYVSKQDSDTEHRLGVLRIEENDCEHDVEGYSSGDVSSPDMMSSTTLSPIGIGKINKDEVSNKERPKLEMSLSMADRLENEQANQIALKEIEAIEKRNKVLSLIAKKAENEDPKPRNFSLFIPESIKNKFDQAITIRNEQQALEIGRLLRVAMGEQSHGEEEDPKSLSSFMSRMKNADGYYAQHKVFSEYCKFIAEHPYFIGMVTFVIVLAGVNVGAQTESRLTSIEPLRKTMVVLDHFILSVFTVEVALKILAEGDRPPRYFYDGWNRFDFVIVVGSYIPGAGSLLTILRLLRLLRVLKLVKSLPQLAVIVNALMMGLGSIGYIGLILFLCFYVFAIGGMMLFRNNDPFHFGNLHIAMFTLFRCSTLDDWSEVLYVNMYGCDAYPGVYEDFPEMCDSPKRQGVLSCIYFLAFIIIGAQVLLTLFIGVVTTSMEQAKEIQFKEENLEKQLASLEKSLCLSSIQLSCFRKAFELLDLDGGGTIEEDEVALGLQSINNLMDGTSIEEEIKKSDPQGTGIDLLQFIVVIANIPRCKHKRLIKRTLKRWRYNKFRAGQYYITKGALANFAMPKRENSNEEKDDVMIDRPTIHANFTGERVRKEKVYELLHSYNKHHKLAFQFFKKNDYSNKLEKLTFLTTKLQRRHSCSHLPESQYEEYLCFGKKFNLSDTQRNENHNYDRGVAENSLRELRNTKRKKLHSGGSRGFFKSFARSHSNISHSDDSHLIKQNSSSSIGGSKRVAWHANSVLSDETEVTPKKKSRFQNPIPYSRSISPMN